VIHYHAEHGHCKPIDVNAVYLCDTGGQYVDGTTDTTRTLRFGSQTPSADERRAYTRVLQGHIALAKAIFPAGTPGLMLEMLARAPLWKDGMNFLHGTGHGIGAFLNVHEGPFGVGGGAVHASKIVKSARMRRMYLAPIEEGCAPPLLTIPRSRHPPACPLPSADAFTTRADTPILPARCAQVLALRRARLLLRKGRSRLWHPH